MVFSNTVSGENADMIEIKNQTNHLIDWKTEAGYEDRVKYFKMFRALLLDLSDLGSRMANDSAFYAIHEVLQKHNVYFLNGDEFPRVNLDIPIGQTEHGGR